MLILIKKVFLSIISVSYTHLKNDNAHRLLSKQLKDHTVVRRYVALVHGLIPHEHGKVDAPIGRNPKDRQSMAVTRTNSKEAVTNFTVLKRYNAMSLIECRLETGRTHQIRVHMSYIGYPVYGDPKSVSYTHLVLFCYGFLIGTTFNIYCSIMIIVV